MFLNPRRTRGDDQIGPGPVGVGVIEALELAAALADPKPLAFVRRRAVNGLTPHRLRMIAYTETANRRSWHVEQTVPYGATLKVRTILLQGACPRWKDGDQTDPGEDHQVRARRSIHGPRLSAGIGESVITADKKPGYSSNLRPSTGGRNMLS